MYDTVRATVVALVILALLVLCVAELVISVKAENACWDAGYELPVVYAGETWCFGRDGDGVAVPISDLLAGR